jgi:hypothetical protein
LSAPLQDFPFLGSSIAPWKYFPYAGGHISTMNPSLGGGFFQSSRPVTGPSTSSGGSGGFSSNVPVGSMPFSLYGAFGKEFNNQHHQHQGT